MGFDGQEGALELFYLQLEGAAGAKPRLGSDMQLARNLQGTSGSFEVLGPSSCWVEKQVPSAAKLTACSFLISFLSLTFSLQGPFLFSFLSFIFCLLAASCQLETKLLHLCRFTLGHGCSSSKYLTFHTSSVLRHLPPQLSASGADCLTEDCLSPAMAS